MIDMHDARVEAACKAYQAAQNADPYDFKGRMSAALAAADAVVTVEMIAEALHGDECPDDPDEGESCGCDGNHYMRQGGIVLALLRGGDGGE